MLGIDIGDNFLKISNLEKYDDVFIVENYKKYDVSEYMHHGLITNPHKVAKCINSFIEEFMINNPKLVFAMPNKDYNFMQTRIFQIPTLSKKNEMKSAIEIELSESYSYDKDNFTLDWCMLNKDFNSNSLIYSCSISNEAKENYEQLLSEFDLPIMFVPKTILLSNIVEKTNKTTLLIDIGYDTTDFIVYHDNIPLLVKTSSIAGKSISEIISSFKGIDFAAANNLKISEGLILSNDFIYDYSSNEVELSSIIETQLQILIDDINRIKEQIRTEYNLNIDSVNLFGSSSRLKYLPEYIEYRLNIPCEILIPCVLQDNTDIDIKEYEIDFATSFAASMIKFNKPLITLESLTQKNINKITFLSIIGGSIFISLLVSTLVITGTFVSNTHYTNTTKKLNAIKISFEDFNNEILLYSNKMDSLNAETEKISNMITTIDFIDNKRIPSCEILKLIKTHTPNKIQLDTISTLSSKVTIEGVSANYMDLGYYIKELEGVENFSDIKFEYEDVLSEVSEKLQIKNLKFKISLSYSK